MFSGLLCHPQSGEGMASLSASSNGNGKFGSDILKLFIPNGTDLTFPIDVLSAPSSNKPNVNLVQSIFSYSYGSELFFFNYAKPSSPKSGVRLNSWMSCCDLRGLTNLEILRWQDAFSKSPVTSQFLSPTTMTTSATCNASEPADKTNTPVVLVHPVSSVAVKAVVLNTMTPSSSTVGLLNHNQMASPNVMSASPSFALLTPAAMHVADKVEVRLGVTNIFYPGVISEVHNMGEDELLYDVNFDDGDVEMKCHRLKIRAPGEKQSKVLVLSQKVDARCVGSDGDVFPGMVIGIDADEVDVYEIKFFDESKSPEKMHRKYMFALHQRPPQK
jgi:hypothetical protein